MILTKPNRVSLASLQHWLLATCLLIGASCLGMACRPSPEELVKREIRAELKALSASVIFDSRVNGNFGIYALDPSSLLPKPLFDSELHEITPDPAPDGSAIVFARGKSAERGQPFDIWTVNSDGSEPQLLAKNGAFPTFHSNTLVIFERGQRQVWSIDRETRVETLIFDAAEGPFRGHQVFLPRLSPDGTHLVFTSTYGRRYSNYLLNLESKTHTLIGRGCEPIWSHTGKTIYWVTDQGAKHITAIMKYEVATGKNTLVIDNDLPRGIDYFPFPDSNETHLLYASAEKRRHYIEGDYQLFLKSLSTNKTYRLLNDSGNHRWPKFLISKHDGRS